MSREIIKEQLILMSAKEIFRKLKKETITPQEMQKLRTFDRTHTLEESKVLRRQALEEEQELLEHYLDYYNGLAERTDEEMKELIENEHRSDTQVIVTIEEEKQEELTRASFQQSELSIGEMFQ